MQRRTFLTTALGGTVALALGVNFALPDNIDRLTEDNYGVIFSILVPVIMDGALPEMENLKQASVFRTIEAIQGTMAVLPNDQLEELEQLLAMLESHLGLLILTGSMTPLMMRNPKDLVAMLESWRNSALVLFQHAYIGLRELVMASFYSCPEHWVELNYAKPTFLDRGA